MSKCYVICHMLTSLDGKIDGAYMSAPECAPALAAYGNLRKTFRCKATLYGTKTMAVSYSDGYVENLAKSERVYPRQDYVAVDRADSYIVSVDPKGMLCFSDNFISKKGRQRAHVIEVLTEDVSDDYLAYLRKLQISYLFAGKDRLDCSLILHKLQKTFSIERLMLAGGGIMNWSFVQEDLVDELSIVMAPVADGSMKTASVFEKADFLPDRTPAVFKLKEAKVLDGNTLWLRYMI